MINNVFKITKLLHFDNPGECYFIQILKRRKDNSGMVRDMEVIDSLFVYSLEDFGSKLARITTTCNAHNARAYIRVNRRNTEKLALITMSKISGMILSKQYEAVYSAYFKSAGEHNSEPVKRWIVDIDSKDKGVIDEFITTITSLHIECNKNDKRKAYYSILDIIETKAGYHIITNPFNTKKFLQLFPGVDIHKDNPTLLYMP